MSNARIDIEVGELYISLEGSELFVTEQYRIITNQLGLFGSVAKEAAKSSAAAIEETPVRVEKPATEKKKAGRTKALKEESKEKSVEEPLAPSAALTEAIKAKSRRAAAKKAEKEAPKAAPSKEAKSSQLPKDFKDWVKMVSGKLNKTDLALLAGFYVQLNSDKKAFRVREASKVLKNNGYDLSNASIFVRNNLKSGKLFEYSKVGSEAYYRLTDKGLERVKKLLGM